MTTTLLRGPNSRQGARLMDVALSPLGVTVELSVLSAGGQNAGLILTGERSFVLGRGSDCDVRFASAEHPRVGTRHAALSLSGSGVVIRGLNAGNGTFVNGRRVVAPTRLVDGDVVALGSEGPRLSVHLIDASADSPSP